MKVKLGKNMKNALEFGKRVNGWHSIKKDRATSGAIVSLHKLKLVEVNKHDQFRITLRGKRAAQALGV